MVSSRFLVHLFLSLSCPPGAEVAALPPPVYQPPACATPDHFEEPSWTPPLMIYIPISCISSTLPWPSATVVSYHTLVISNRGQLFPTLSQMENLRLGVHNLFQSTDNGVAQLSILMTSFFLAQCNEKKKAIKIDDCYPLPFLPCTGF